MSGLVQRVRERVDARCVATRIRKEGCRVSLEDAPQPYLIVDFDKPGSPLGPSDERCDYLLVANAADFDGWVVPLELKRGRFDAGGISDQLQAGAGAAERLLPRNFAVEFQPIAVFGGGTTKAERLEARKKKNWVRFRGSAREMLLMKSGQKLADQFR